MVSILVIIYSNGSWTLSVKKCKATWLDACLWSPTRTFVAARRRVAKWRSPMVHLCSVIYCKVKASQTIAFSDCVVNLVPQRPKHDSICERDGTSKVMYLVFNRELESGCQKPVGSCGPEFSKGFGGTTAPGFREVNSHTKVVHQVQDDLYHQKKFNYLDQSRIRSEQGRMKFYVFLFLAFFTCFDQFSTCLNICSHFYSIFHIFLACFHFIFVFF